jgi:hypothetical protein
MRRLFLLFTLTRPTASDLLAAAAVGTARSAFSSACAAAPHPVCGDASASPASASAPSAAWALSDALSAVRRFPEAASLRERVLSSGAALAALPSSWAALATDLRHARRYPEALTAVRGAQRAAAGGGGGGEELLATLLEFEAEVLSCAGGRRALEALRVFARAQKARRGGEGSAAAPRRGAEVALQELALLDRLLGGGPAAAAGALPEGLARGLADRRAAAAAAMVARGPWRSAQQLPAHFEPSLRAAPWWAVGDAAGGDGARGAAARAALVAAAPALRAEFAALRDAARLEPELECIVEPPRGGAGAGAGVGAARGPAGGGAPEAGGWRVLTAQAPWHEGARDGHRCAAALAPAACALNAQLLALGLPVTRVGFSALAPGAVLHPHFGPTNTALKFHLGLHVPLDAAGAGCAAITVGGDTRRWERDGVLAFDDSFLHNVSFPEGCGGGEERVVFQVVFLHPEAGRLGGGQPQPQAMRGDL